MLGDITGYVLIKKNATTCKGALRPEEFIGNICRVMEFNSDGDVLVLNSQATALAMFDKVDVERKFKCSQSGIVICAPGLHALEQMAYVTKCMTRKGGYNDFLSQMVIAASLAKGEFTDDFLWQKQ